MGFSKKRTGADVTVEHGDASAPRSQAAVHLSGSQLQHRQDPVSIMPFWLSENTALHLIDTPGLDNVNISDLDVFTKIAEYLRDPVRSDRGVTRIIYVHPAGDTLRSRTLQQNLKTILELFTIKTERLRLTILVSPIGTQGVDPQAVVEAIRHSNVGAHKEATRRGATIETAPPNLEGFASLLRSYTLQPPIFPPIFFVEFDARHPTIESWIEESLGYCDKRSVDSRILSYEKKLESYEKKIRELQASATRNQESHEQLKLQHAEQQKTEVSLRQQLREVKNDYGFLRSQVQAQDNHDQEGIAEGLVHLNKDIEDIGQSIAEDVTDSYVENAFGRDPSRVFASDAKDLAQLKLKLGHSDGKSSLIESSEGKSLSIEEFFDFVTRTLLCNFLYEKIFRPFHPHLDLASRELRSVHRAFGECYHDVQKYEPQYMAGKWRSIAFRSVGNMKRKNSQPLIDAENLTQDFLNNHLYPLLGAFFGQKPSEFLLNKQQSGRLHRSINMALEWNSKLKGEVIALGDYTQTVYSAGADYDARLMEELQVESNLSPGRRQPVYILGTLALGLVCKRATGQGQPPVETVLEKALVATESLYT